MKKLLVFGVAALVAMAATAQSSILLEACNNIADSNKRLACLQELMNSRPAASSQTDPSLERVKNAFLGLQGTVSSGLSYNAYVQQILEPASALGIYRASAKADPVAVGMFETSLQAYKDAQEIWRASIHDSRDAGIYGQVLDYRRTGLVQIIERYQLPVTRVVGIPHLPAQSALPVVWRQASEQTDMAIRRIETGYAPVPAPDPAAVARSAATVRLRTGLVLNADLIIQSVDRNSANSGFAVAAVLESVGKQPVANFEQLIAALNSLPNDQDSHEATVRYHGVTLTLPLKLR